LWSVAFVRAIAWADRARPSGWRRLAAPPAVLAIVGLLSIVFPELLGNGQDVAWQVTSSSSNVTATWACTSQAWVCVGVVLGSSATQITAALTPSASVAATNAKSVALTGNLTCQRVAPWRKRRNGLFIPDLVIPRLRIAI